MDVECEVCRGTHFYVRDGITYCSRCNCESQAHGQETVVDDETIGTFQPGIASSLRTSTKGRSKSDKRRRKRTSKYLVSFTTPDAFSYIIKGWTEDAIELGAPASTIDTVKALWCNYLKKIGVTLDEPNESDTSSSIVSVGKYLTFRDAQVQVTGRRKIVASGHVSSKRKSRLKMTSAEKRKKMESEQDEADFDELEKRRRLKKRRRKFINSLISEDLATSDTDASHFSTATSSHRSDDFGMSFSSFDLSSGSGNASDLSLDSSALSISTGLSSSDDRSSLSSMDEDDTERLEIEMRVLERLCKQNSMAARMKLNDPAKITLRRTFAIFALAVFMTEENELALSDLVYWANRDSIAFKTSRRHLPPVMRMQSGQDVHQFSPCEINLHPLSHIQLRRNMNKIGRFLGLENAIFPTKSLDRILERFIKDLSLPSELFTIIKTSIQNVESLNEIKFEFPTKTGHKAPFPSLDVSACGLILFALKYLYGLDDKSELYRSADARKLDQDNPTKRHFVICDWIEMTRQRVFLCVRYSNDLHRRFKTLFPRVEMSLPTLHRRFENLSKLADNLEQVPIKDEVGKRKYHWKVKDPENIERVSNFFEQNFGESKRQLILNGIDLSKSMRPLQDFSTYFIDIKDSVDCELDSQEIETLTKLLHLHDSEIGLRNSNLDSEEVKDNGLWIMTRINRRLVEDEKCQTTYSKTEQPKVEHSKYYRFEAEYWRSKFRCGDYWHRSPMCEDFLSCFPENFGFILKYLSAYCEANPLEVYRELYLIEKQICQQNPEFFGVGIRTADRHVGGSVWGKASDH